MFGKINLLVIALATVCVVSRAQLSALSDMQNLMTLYEGTYQGLDAGNNDTSGRFVALPQRLGFLRGGPHARQGYISDTTTSSTGVRRTVTAIENFFLVGGVIWSKQYVSTSRNPQWAQWIESGDLDQFALLTAADVKELDGCHQIWTPLATGTFMAQKGMDEPCTIGRIDNRVYREESFTHLLDNGKSTITNRIEVETKSEVKTYTKL